MSGPDAVAAAVCEAMEANDRPFIHYGMRVVEIAPGRSVLEMAVREDMLNGHDVCHGGVLFTLADTAFAVACNSHNRIAVAAGADMTFIAAARAGDVLRAEASERALRRRTGVYDVTVSANDGRLVALFRGRAHRLDAKVVESLPAFADRKSASAD
jgi:acyl-CoA thioesterase